MGDISRLTLMLCVSDMARADIALTADRIYYRFATDESIEDGELPASKENFTSLAERIVSSAKGAENESVLLPEVKVNVFVDNRRRDMTVSEESLRRMVDELCGIAEEFMFLRGFC